MPGIAFALANLREQIGPATVVLQDIDAEGLELQRRLTGRILSSRGAPDIRVEAQPDRLRAIEGCDLVLAAFRPGGFAARHLDESIAIEHGIVGQETAGPGGFAMSLRSVPIVLDIAKEMTEVGASGAVLLNYTNPVQIVSEAMARFAPDVPFLGLCDQTGGEAEFLARLMGASAKDVELDTRGTNHMTFTDGVRLAGADSTQAVFETLDGVDLDSLKTDEERHIVQLFRMLRNVPSEYMQYFFFHDEVLAKQRASGTRAQEVMAMLPDVAASYRAEAEAEYPRPSMARASEGHGDFAVSIMAAMLGETEQRFILNLPNDGQVADLPQGAVVETPALIRGRTWKPIPSGSLPSEVSGLVRQVAEHARLAAEAAVTGDRALCVKALAIHPLVRSLNTAESLTDAYLKAHAQHLPRPS
jgi:6-phospho-beta-glucosidase